MTIPQEFFIERQGKKFVLYVGLIDEAHQRGIKSIDTELLQAPTDENGHVAICKATVEMVSGQTFSGIGDASKENVSKNIMPHIIRQSETRAKARALRDALNIGATALEELSEEEPNPDDVAERGGAVNINEREPTERQLVLLDELYEKKGIDNRSQPKNMGQARTWIQELQKRPDAV